MKIAFFGTPVFSIPSLRKLASSKHQVIGVVTAPDKPRGRGLEVIPSPISSEAEKLNLPVLKPINLEDIDFLDSLRNWQADLLAVVAFRILPVAIFSMAPRGAVNLHASLLPAYRGAAPIQRALWNGETVTGVTSFQIEQKVDTGNILKQRKVEIFKEDNAGSLSERLAEIGADLLLETVNDLESGCLTPIPQDPGLISRAPKISHEDCLINWKRKANEIHNQVRALSPEPGCTGSFDGNTIKIYKTQIQAGLKQLGAGELQIEDSSMTAGTVSGELDILELQLQGKKRMHISEFLRGFRLRGKFRFTTT